MNMLVDSHCHLDFPDFSDDIEQVIENAHAHDIKIMQTICTKMTEFPKVRAVAEAHDNIYCSVGIHPHEVETQPETSAETLIEHSKHEKVIGIGETGLDYFYEHSPRDLQKTSFRQHIIAARDTNLPLIVHTRDADEDTIEIMEEEHANGVYPALIHCFSSTKWLAYRALEMGHYISISGIVTFKKATDLQEIVKELPLERLLVETDAPYLAPVPKRGKRNEPAFTKYTAEFVAQLKGISYEEVARVTTENFFELFNKVPNALK